MSEMATYDLITSITCITWCVD